MVMLGALTLNEMRNDLAEVLRKVMKSSCENTKITGKTKHLKSKNGQKYLKIYLFIEMYLF